MQRVGVTTRSSSYVYQDQNMAGSKPSGIRPTGGRRTALGDISNRNNVFHDPSVPSKPQHPTKPARLPSRGVRRAPTVVETAENIAPTFNQFDQLQITHNKTGLRSGAAALQAPRPAPINEWDSADQNNAQACVDYVDEIMQHLKDTESDYVPSPDYMSKQTDINARMRAILVDWLVEVQVKFKLHSESLYLTVNLIDRFLERKMVPRTKLQLVGVTAMLLASKYEEIYPPEVKDFVYITDNTYSREELLHSESSMLAQLSFNMTVPVVPTFLARYAKVCRADNVTVSLANYYSEVALAAYESLHYKASHLAAAVLCMALRTTGMGRWGSTLTSYTGYTEDSMVDIMHLLRHKLAEKSTDPKCQAVVKKYASSRFYNVSKLPLPPN